MSPGTTLSQQSDTGTVGVPIAPMTYRSFRNLTEPRIEILRSWFMGHLDHLHANEEDERVLKNRIGLTRSQVRE